MLACSWVVGAPALCAKRCRNALCAFCNSRRNCSTCQLGCLLSQVWQNSATEKVPKLQPSAEPHTGRDVTADSPCLQAATGAQCEFDNDTGRVPLASMGRYVEVEFPRQSVMSMILCRYAVRGQLFSQSQLAAGTTDPGHPKSRDLQRRPICDRLQDAAPLTSVPSKTGFVTQCGDGLVGTLRGSCCVHAQRAPVFRSGEPDFNLHLF